MSGGYRFAYWWPAESPAEVIEEAILTQNTSWKNVERAMEGLRGKGINEILGDAGLRDRIRSAGFSVQKERYLRSVLGYFKSTLENLSLPPDTRTELLELEGIGRETADSIALYAFHQRTIPVDSYTLRLFNRYFGANFTNKDYEDIRASLTRLFNQEQLMELHALTDEHCKEICKKIPRCNSCFLKERCARNF